MNQVAVCRRWCNRGLFFLPLVLLLWGTSLGAEQPQEETPKDLRDLTEISLEDLLNVEVEVASEQPKIRSATPGIVSVITRAEIENLGARDLIDILRAVPGLDFGVDNWGVVGLGSRGLWGHDGKILILYDGHELNERMYGGFDFGNHLSVDQIERIEIIRGPGSVMYGGFAELAVINIISRMKANVEGGGSSVTLGYFKDGVARQNLQAWAARRLGEDFCLGVGAFSGFGHRTDNAYTDAYGSKIDLSDEHQLNPTTFNLDLRYGAYRLNFMLDNFRTTFRDGYDAITDRSYDSNFYGYFLNTSYEWEVLPALQLIPEFKFKAQQPWYNSRALPDLTTNYYYTNIVYDYDAALKAQFQPGDWLHLMAGGEFNLTHADYKNNYPFPPLNSRTLSMRNVALFSEADTNTPYLDFTAGVRFDYHDKFGNSTVPRFSLNKTYGPWHGKFLYSWSFRSAGVEQYRGGIDVRKEKAYALEAEVGYQLHGTLFLTANFYDIKVKRPVVYFFDPATGVDGYINGTRQGSRGAELELKYKRAGSYAAVGYSYYHTAYSDTDYFKVPGHDSLYLAFPGHKLAASGSIQLYKGLTANPSLIFTSKRYGYDYFGAPVSSAAVKKFDPEAVFNLFLLYRDAWMKGLDLGAGIYDLFGANHQFIQPYNANHTPLPGPGREFLMKISYEWQ